MTEWGVRPLDACTFGGTTVRVSILMVSTDLLSEGYLLTALSLLYLAVRMLAFSAERDSSSSSAPISLSEKSQGFGGSSIGSLEKLSPWPNFAKKFKIVLL